MTWRVRGIGEDNFSSITENSLVVLDDFSFKLANNKQAKIKEQERLSNIEMEIDEIKQSIKSIEE